MGWLSIRLPTTVVVWLINEVLACRVLPWRGSKEDAPRGAAPMTRDIALTALAVLGLSGALFHDPFHRQKLPSRRGACPGGERTGPLRPRAGAYPPHAPLPEGYSPQSVGDRSQRACPVLPHAAKG